MIFNFTCVSGASSSRKYVVKQRHEDNPSYLTPKEISDANRGRLSLYHMIAAIFSNLFSYPMQILTVLTQKSRFESF